MNPTQTTLLPEMLAHAGWTRRLAYSLVSDKALADDLVQDTWTAAVAHPPVSGSEARPWIRTVLRNAFYKRMTKHRRGQVRDEAFAATLEAPTSPEELMIRMESQRMLAEIVGALEEPYRQAVLLRYYEGHSSAQIGTILGVPAGTVRWRLKAGIDQIRQKLDDRHAGKRQAWMGLLIPASLPRDALAKAPAMYTKSRPWWTRFRLQSAMVLGVLGIVATAMWFHRSSELRSVEGTPSAPRGPTGNANDNGGPIHGGLRWAAAPTAMVFPSLKACSDELTKLRREVPIAESDAIRLLPAQQLFERGQPNPTAQAALLPDIARILKGDRPAAPPHTLDCRTWACRLLVLQTKEEAKLAQTNLWMLPMQKDPAFTERTQGRQFKREREIQDPVSGEVLIERPVYLKLRDPSGARIAKESPRKTPPMVGQIPATMKACTAEVAALTARLKVARAEAESNKLPHEIFNASPPNPKLEAEVKEVAKRVLNPEELALSAITCRGQICKVSGPEGPACDEWTKKFRNDDYFRSRLDKTMMNQAGGEVHFSLSPTPRASGSDILRKLTGDIKASPELRNCAHKHPSSGVLTLGFQLPLTGEPNDDGEIGKISVHLGDALARTPLGHCVEALAQKAILATPLPDAVTGASLKARLTFPL